MKVIVSLSGGMDSSTVLGEALSLKREVVAVGFSYGSKHNQFENESAKRVAAHYDVPFELIDLTVLAGHLKSDLLKSGGPIPEGHYSDESMTTTVVPDRNIVFASILAGIAWSNGADQVWLGIHAGDHAIYPDCRPEFFKAMQQAILFGTNHRVELIAPFLNDTKVKILERGWGLGVPYHLTRTCYKAQVIACGKCGACVERLEAFAKNGLVDSITYEES